MGANEEKDVSGLGGGTVNEARSLIGKSVDVMQDAINANENAYSSISNTGGLIRENAAQIKTTVSDAFLSISRLGGSFNDAQKQLEAYMLASNKTAMLQDETLTKLYSTAKVGGMELQT